MKYTVQINASPYRSQAAESAYRFINAALASGYCVPRVFFYFDGIYNAWAYAAPPDDERQVVARWSRLAEDYDIDLVVCVSAAQRRGLLSGEEAARRNKRDNDLAEGFRISGLGQLAEAILESDRFILFG
ncbi:MAG: sulfurtransferase complex subunit TusD [Gammaproteobacteria bacterium]